MNNVYMGALSYADDITIICPSIRGLNKMLKICNEFAQSNKIIFNSKKTICIKFGDKHITPEKAFLNSECLSWTDNIRHLGNFIDCSNRDMVDCGIKKGMFIGYVNKLRSNYDTLQPHILINLFKSYCCSFYGSMLWKYNSEGFDKICKSWNIAIRTLLRLPFNTHTRYLGPLIGQQHIRTQLYVRDFIFLWNAYRSCNIIVKTCMNNAVYNSNTCIGYKLSFFRNTFCLDMKCKLTRAITLIRNVHLNVNEQAIVDTLIALIDVRAGHLVIDHFSNDDIVNMINELSIA